MLAPPVDRAPRGLGAYVLCAAAIHAVIFALTSSRPVRPIVDAQPARPKLASIDVDGEASCGPSSALPGGGSPLPATPPPGMGRSRGLAASRAPRSRPARPSDDTTPRDPDAISSATSREAHDDAAGSDTGEALALAEAQADNDRRERAMATGWVGLGPWSGDGPGGPGGRWRAPAVRGNTPFGNGSRGALTGRVCFLPPDTYRIADVQSCRYVATVYTDTLDVPERQYFDGFPGVTNRSDWFLIDYTGKFSVTGYGRYVFRLHSDDGSYLYVDDALVIENDGKHAPESRSGSVELAVGEHRIRVLYAQTTDRMALQLFVRTPGSTEMLFTPHL